MCERAVNSAGLSNDDCCPPTHFSLDHVDASGAEGLDTIIDVHHSFALGHIQHNIQHNVAAGPTCAHTGAEERREGSTSLSAPLK